MSSRVAILESRLAGELTNLLTRQGFVPYCVPLVVTKPTDCERDLANVLDEFGQHAHRAAVFSTGQGVRLIFDVAERMDRLVALRQVLSQSQIVCRGPKPTAALKVLGFKDMVVVPEPFTTTELVRTLGTLDLAQRHVLVVHDGEINVSVVHALEQARATVHSIQLYTWAIPDDLGPARELLGEMLARRIDAIAFTNKMQVRHLIDLAEGCNVRDEVIGVMRNGIVIAAVGPTCAAALRDYGIEPTVVPSNPKMGPMVLGLARHLSSIVSSAAS